MLSNSVALLDPFLCRVPEAFIASNMAM